MFIDVGRIHYQRCPHKIAMMLQGWTRLVYVGRSCNNVFLMLILLPGLFNGTVGVHVSVSEKTVKQPGSAHVHPPGVHGNNSPHHVVHKSGSHNFPLDGTLPKTGQLTAGHVQAQVVNDDDQNYHDTPLNRHSLGEPNRPVGSLPETNLRQSDFQGISPQHYLAQDSRGQKNHLSSSSSSDLGGTQHGDIFSLVHDGLITVIDTVLPNQHENQNNHDILTQRGGHFQIHSDNLDHVIPLNVVGPSNEQDQVSKMSDRNEFIQIPLTKAYGGNSAQTRSSLTIGVGHLQVPLGGTHTRPDLNQHGRLHDSGYHGNDDFQPTQHTDGVKSKSSSHVHGKIDSNQWHSVNIAPSDVISSGQTNSIPSVGHAHRHGMTNRHLRKDDNFMKVPNNVKPIVTNTGPRTFTSVAQNMDEHHSQTHQGTIPVLPVHAGFVGESENHGVHGSDSSGALIQIEFINPSSFRKFTQLQTSSKGTGTHVISSDIHVPLILPLISANHHSLTNAPVNHRIFVKGLRSSQSSADVSSQKGNGSSRGIKTLNNSGIGAILHELLGTNV